MFAGSWVIIIGMILACSGNHIAQFMIGRFVLGLGIAVMTVAAPAYSMEIAPPQWRGRCTGLYNCGWFGGSIPAAAVTFGCSYIKSDIQWRLPLILQAVAAMIVIGLVWFIPESPRYMMAQGDEEGAHAFLTKYHGNGDPNAPLVLFQLKEMRESITVDSIDKVWWDYRPLFLTRGGRWRMAQVLMISIFGQFSGNGLGYFNVSNLSLGLY
jgi:MFS family permease